MKTLLMIGLQAALIIGTSLLLAYSIHFPEPHLRPVPPPGFYWPLTGFLSIALVAIAFFTGRMKATSQIAISASTVALLLVSWYVSIFLWVNTYGS
jgi:hypothetical protein